MKKYRWVSILLIALCLTGCKDAPDDLTKKDKAQISTEDLTYMSVREIRQESESLCGSTYQQLVLPDVISLPDASVTEIPVLEMSDMTDFTAHVQEVAHTIWGRDDFETNALIEKEQGDDTTLGKSVCYRLYDDEEHTEALEWMALYEKGLVCVSRNGTEEVVDIAGDQNYINYDVTVDDYEDETYELEDGSVTLGEMKSYVEETLNQSYAPEFVPDYQYRVTWITVKPTQDGNNILDFYLEKSWQGVEIEGSCDYEPENDEILQMQDYFYGGQEVEVQMTRKEQFQFFREMSAVPEQKEDVGDLLSLRSALAIVSAQLADKNTFCFDGVRLCYTLRMQNPEDEKTGRRTYIPTQNVFEEYMSNGCEARPTWVFYQTKHDSASSGRAYTLFVVVDALDGTFQYYKGNMR